MALVSVRVSQPRVLQPFAIVAAFAWAAITMSITRAEEFRVETKVYLGDNEKPVSEATTLFHGRDVYDFLKEARQTAVFRKPNGKNPGRFILLDDTERIRTEIGTDQLAGAIDKVRNWAGQQSNPFLKFAANPDFEESFEPTNGQLLLVSHLESYRVETAPARHPKAASEYREFLDWYAQLNTLLSGGPPPQQRLTVELLRGGDDETLRAQHEFTWRLSKDDMQRIDDVHAALASYRELSNEEYLRRTASVEMKR
jgi:hypothetical protein